MKDIITKLYAVCINKRQFSSPREDKKNGWYGTMFRGLDMSQVVAMKSELEAMVQKLGPEFRININRKGDKYYVDGKEHTTKSDFVWLSRDTRNEQTIDDALMHIPAEYLG